MAAFDFWFLVSVFFVLVMQTCFHEALLDSYFNKYGHYEPEEILEKQIQKNPLFTVKKMSNVSGFGISIIPLCTIMTADAV